MLTKFNFSRKQWYNADEADEVFKQKDAEIADLKAKFKDASNQLEKMLEWVNKLKNLSANLTAATDSISLAVTILQKIPSIELKQDVRPATNPNPKVGVSSDKTFGFFSSFEEDNSHKDFPEDVELMKSDIGVKLVNIIKNKLELSDTDKIKASDTLHEDLGADDLDLVEIVMEAEDTFEIEILDSDVSSIVNIRAFIKLIKEKRHV